MNPILELFLTFAKIGLFTFGGGYAMIPVIEDSCVQNKKWITHEQMLQITVIAESTPGPIAINAATYVGYHIAGIPGAVDATFGLITPSVIVIIIVSQFLKKFGDSKYVKAVMYGLRAASAGLIAAAGLMVARVTLLHPEAWKQGDLAGVLNGRSLLLALVLVFLTGKYKKVHPIAFLAASAVVGVVFGFGQ